MQDTKAGIRYAKSLFHLAQERNEMEKVSADMALIDKTIHENSELRSMLKSPIIKSDKKALIRVNKTILTKKTRKRIKRVS